MDIYKFQSDVAVSCISRLQTMLLERILNRLLEPTVELTIIHYNLTGLSHVAKANGAIKRYVY